VKNLFAIVGGMVSTGARSHVDVAQFALDIRERIAALGRAHSLASPTGESQAIDLAELIQTTIAPYRDHAAITMDGPSIRIDRSCLSPLALMLHEWATNAAKYGALGPRHGALAIRWAKEDEGLTIDWSETGSDPVESTPGKGFGTVLVETSSRQLGAIVTRHIEGTTFAIQARLPGEVLADD
jgi:two-component system, chemotaxis family, CheB/CheR fusion protein